MKDVITDDYKLLHGDCLERMKEIESGSVDLVLTDPPYKIIQGGCTNKAVTFKGTSITETKNGKVFKNNSIKFSDWVGEVFRVLKDNSHCYIMCNDRNLQELLNVSDNVGFKLLNVLVWGKSKHAPNRYYLKNVEFIVMLRKGSAKNINNMGTKSLLLIDNVDKKQHPTEKPTGLLKILIENSSQVNETILDPFTGSCSTGIACLNTNRKFIGIELDDNYFYIGAERMRNHIKNE